MNNSVTINSLRNELIGEILQLGDEGILQQIKQYIADKKYKNKINKKSSTQGVREDLPYDLKAYIKPLVPTTDFEVIIKQQNFKGINRKDFDKAVEELNIQESLVDLI